MAWSKLAYPAHGIHMHVSWFCCTCCMCSFVASPSLLCLWGLVQCSTTTTQGMVVVFANGIAYHIAGISGISWSSLGWTLYSTDFEILRVKFLWLASRPRKFYPTKNTRYTVFPDHLSTVNMHGASKGQGGLL